MAASHDFGRSAEDLAAALLGRLGWRVEARNWRAGHKEIDLVARRGRTVAFIEVKARAPGSMVSPLAAITAGKRRDLEHAARVWIARHGRPGDEYRFDAVAVVGSADGRAVLEHVEDAWWC